MTEPELKELKMVCGSIALVDPDIYELAKNKTWRINTHGYPQWVSTKDGKSISLKLHELVINVPKGKHSDHINRNKLDNRRCNLRIVTPSQNAMNAKIRTDGVSKYRGVHWKKEMNQWCASLGYRGKRIHLGYWEHEIDAAKAYNRGAIVHHGECANLNTIEPQNG